MSQLVSSIGRFLKNHILGVILLAIITGILGNFIYDAVKRHDRADQERLDGLYYNSIDENAVKAEMKTLVDKEKHSLLGTGVYVTRDLVGVTVEAVNIAFEVEGIARHSFVVVRFNNPRYRDFIPLVPATSRKNTKEYFIGILELAQDDIKRDIQLEVISKYVYGRYQSSRKRLSELRISPEKLTGELVWW
jgi:hypothetical protein